MTSKKHPLPGLHVEGHHFLSGFFFLLVLLNWMIYTFVAITWLFIAVITLSVVLFALALNFFRKPHRINPRAEEEGVITSPCDGKLVVVEEVFEEEILKERCLKVSIFMSILNVHINWIAIKGHVTYVSHTSGNFHKAFLPKSSAENERSAIVIENECGQKVLERQIAGAVARRVITYSQVGEEVDGNSFAGFIKFGSRVDLYLPLGTSINIPIGTMVKGNSTVLGKLPIE